MTKYITYNDWTRADNLAQCAIANIPAAHNRKRKHIYNKTLRNAIRNAPERTKGKINGIIYDYTVNMGNRKYPDCLNVVGYAPLSELRETPKCYFGCGRKIRKNTIIAYVKA